MRAHAHAPSPPAGALRRTAEQRGAPVSSAPPNRPLRTTKNGPVRPSAPPRPTQTPFPTPSAPLLLLLFTLSFMRDPKPAGEGSAPPVWTGGWPLIGHFASFAANPVGTIKAGYLACGPVFTMKFLGFPMTFLIGPDAQAPFFRANDDELSQNEPYKFMTPIFGKGVVFDAPLSVKNQQLRFVSSSLKAAALKTYVPMIVKETEAYLDTWGESGEVDLLHAMARLTILTASRCLLGPEVRENMFEEVASLLHTLDEGISPMAIFFPNLPFYPPFRRRDAARAEIHRLFSKVILARRTAGVKREDMLQAFMDAEYKDGAWEGAGGCAASRL